MTYRVRVEIVCNGERTTAMTASTATERNLLEKIGIALVGVRVIGSGIDEEEAREEDYDEDFGDVTGLRLRVYNEQSINPVLRFQNGEYESTYAMLTRGDDPDLIKLADDDDLSDEDWENMDEEEGFLYLSQVLASMTYGTAPYAKGDHDLNVLLTELGITDFSQLTNDEESNVNRDVDAKLVAMFNEEAAKRGLEPQDHFGFSYSID